MHRAARASGSEDAGGIHCPISLPAQSQKRIEKGSRNRADRQKEDRRESAPLRLPDSSESESPAGEGPRGPGRRNFASSLVDSERCLPDGHVWPEINTRPHQRQDWTALRQPPGNLASSTNWHFEIGLVPSQG